MPNEQTVKQELVAAIRKKDQAFERLTHARHEYALTIAGVRLAKSTERVDRELSVAGTIYEADCEALAEMILAASAQPTETTARPLTESLR